MKRRIILSTLALTAFLTSCSSTIEQPKGTSKGYSSARLVKTEGRVTTNDIEDSPLVHKMVQKTIAAEFQSNGIAFGASNAELVVAYMLIRQDSAMTTMNKDYFGNGRDPNAIMDAAHKKGVLENKRPDEFEDGAIVIDILDARTNELIYRNFTKGGVAHNISTGHRLSRVSAAVNATLADFFKK